MRDHNGQGDGIERDSFVSDTTGWIADDFWGL